MKILVPGGGGYFGAMLIPQLLAVGHVVTVFDTGWFGPSHLPKENDNLTLIKGDIRDWKKYRDACFGKDAIIFLASISSDTMIEKNKSLAYQVNFQHLANAISIPKNLGAKRFIYASSVAAYGNADNATEDMALAPTTSYGRAKAIAEEEVRRYADKSFCCTIVRCASICGYSPHMRFDITVNRMVHDAIKKAEITVNGGGQKRSHISMEDAYAAYRLLLDLPVWKIAGETFNIVGDNMTVMQSAELIQQALPDVLFKINVRPRSDTRSYSVNGEKARVHLGFVPKVSIRDAVADLAVHFEAGYWKDSLTNQQYQNLADGLA